MPRLQQRREARVAIARVVVHHDQIPCALLDEALYQLVGNASRAEAADHDGGSVLDVRDGLRNRAYSLVQHSRNLLQPD